MKKHALALLMCSAASAHAGYYAWGHRIDNNATLGPSACYLVPSMAVGALLSGSYAGMPLSSMDAGTGDAGTWTAKSSMQASIDYVSGQWAGCSAQALGGTIPTMLGGVADPVIVSGNIAGAGQTGGGGTSVTFPDLFQISSEDGVLLSVAMVGLWGVGFIFSALKKALSVDDVIS